MGLSGKTDKLPFLFSWGSLVPFSIVVCCRGSVGSREIMLCGGRWPGLTFPAPPGHYAGIQGIFVDPQFPHVYHGQRENLP